MSTTTAEPQEQTAKLEAVIEKLRIRADHCRGAAGLCEGGPQRQLEKYRHQQAAFEAAIKIAENIRDSTNGE